jgi:hypothetical protein
MEMLVLFFVAARMRFASLCRMEFALEGIPACQMRVSGGGTGILGRKMTLCLAVMQGSLFEVVRRIMMVARCGVIAGHLTLSRKTLSQLSPQRASDLAHITSGGGG